MLNWKLSEKTTLCHSYILLYYRLYAALPREAEVMVAVLTDHFAANVDAPYERKHVHFLTNGP